MKSSLLRFSEGMDLIDSLSVWLDEFDKLPQDPTGDLAPKNLADFVDNRVTGKLDIVKTVVRFDPAPSFTWQKGIFEDAIRAMSKVPAYEPISPALKIATGWQLSVLASSVTVKAGAKMNPPFTATNGIVGTAKAIIDPIGVSLGFMNIFLKLSAAALVENRRKSEFPRAVYEAFRMVTITITGIDTTLPASGGPIPFSYPLMLAE